jgi:hypothetical protein
VHLLPGGREVDVFAVDVKRRLISLLPVRGRTGRSVRNFVRIPMRSSERV